jgi:hypothetical protein
MFGRLGFPRGAPDLYKSCTGDNHIRYKQIAELIDQLNR